MVVSSGQDTGPKPADGRQARD